ncbi:TPA: hypothetical protein N0F65_007972 [Lagenidium giganteum]|uniref:Uncharacterized protein n=1 Tax=Lagenidium giganteum TaxID=4803 RepID=A0AAV2YK20_9STRA|nr:TPA: hypothetical protein N0F65_007972 [Lagenidium giganteum]
MAKNRSTRALQSVDNVIIGAFKKNPSGHANGSVRHSSSGARSSSHHQQQRYHQRHLHQRQQHQQHHEQRHHKEQRPRSKSFERLATKLKLKRSHSDPTVPESALAVRRRRPSVLQRFLGVFAPKRPIATPVEPLRVVSVTEIEELVANQHFVIPPVDIPSNYHSEDRRGGVLVAGKNVTFTFASFTRKRQAYTLLRSIPEHAQAVMPEMGMTATSVYASRAYYPGAKRRTPVRKKSMDEPVRSEWV